MASIPVPPFTRFHMLVAFSWQFCQFFGVQMLFPIFSSYTPKWRCQFYNTTSLPSLGSDSATFSKNCTIFQHCIAPNIIEFDHIYFHSAALEFNWICGSMGYLVPLFAQIQFCGVLIGTLFFGSLSDCFGRKPVAMFVLSFGISVLVLSGFAPNWQILLGARFFVGLCIGGVVVVVYTWTMELVLPEHRIPIRSIFNWGNGRLIMTIICIIFPHWRIASFACALVTSIALIMVILVMPESPTWLYNKGKLKELEESERRIAKIAGLKYQKVQHQAPPKKKTAVDLFRDKDLRGRVLVLWFMWFTSSMCSYATDLNSSEISGNLFVNQILFSIITDRLLVKKRNLGIVFLPVFCSLVLYNFLFHLTHCNSVVVIYTSIRSWWLLFFLGLTIMTLLDQTGVVILVTNLLGLVFIEYTWDACYLCAVECMPTEMRATAVGSCSLMARVGAIIAPILAYLNTMWAPSGYLVVSVFGSLNLFVSYKWLIETRGISLNQVSPADHSPLQTHSDKDKVKEEL